MASASLTADQFLDPRWRLSNLYYITDKTGTKIKFEPNESQLAFLNETTALNQASQVEFERARMATDMLQMFAAPQGQPERAIQ